MIKKIIVIGNGMVGYKFCERLTDRISKIGKKQEYKIITFCEENIPAYDRVHLSSYFEGKSINDLSMASIQWYKKRKIDLYINDKVIDIDREKKIIYSQNGKKLSYHIAIFATGSTAFVPSVSGCDKEGIFVYRTISDLDAIRSYAKKSKRCAVIGGGLLGLEAAKAAQDLNLETSVVEFAERLMPRQLDKDGGYMLKSLIEEKGLKVLLSKQTNKFSGNKKVEKLVFADGSKLTTDMVIISAGIRPRDDLAKKIGLKIGERGGIIVDNFLKTSDKNIFAIGECALHQKMIYGLVAPGYQMATIVCNNLFGENEEFISADMSTKLKLIGTDVCSFGDITGQTSTEVSINNNVQKIYKKIFICKKTKTLIGGILVGDSSEYNQLLQYYCNQSKLPENSIDLITSRSDTSVKPTLPINANICSCENVNKNTICQSIIKGNKTIDSIKIDTKAGTGCGGCTSLISEILEEELANAGEEIDKSLCEHFKYTRVELFDLIKKNKFKNFSNLIKEYGQGLGCEICKPAIASIFSSLWNNLILEQPEILDTNDTFLANIQKNGTYSIVPRVAGGEITAEQLIALGQIAKKYNLYTKITGGQRIDLFGARLEELPLIWEKLIVAGFETGHAYGKSLRTIKSCVGKTWCRYGVGDSTALAIKLENRYKGIRSPHKLKSAVSGCTRECAEAQSKDFGIISTENGWNLYVCGNGGMKPRHGDLLASDLDEETLIKYIDRFLIYYINTADKLTRTSVWLEKLDGGISYLKKVIIEDSLGICQELEKQMNHLIKTYKCEWKDVVENSDKRKRFRPFINSQETDETVLFSMEREQIRPKQIKEIVNV